MSCQGSWAVLGPQEIKTSWVQCRRRRRNRGEGSGACWRLGERLKVGARVLPTHLHFPHQHLSGGDHSVQEYWEVTNHVALPSPKPAPGQRVALLSGGACSSSGASSKTRVLVFPPALWGAPGCAWPCLAALWALAFLLLQGNAV